MKMDLELELKKDNLRILVFVMAALIYITQLSTAISLTNRDWKYFNDYVKVINQRTETTSGTTSGTKMDNPQRHLEVDGNVNAKIVTAFEAARKSVRNYYKGRPYEDFNWARFEEARVCTVRNWANETTLLERIINLAGADSTPPTHVAAEYIEDNNTIYTYQVCDYMPNSELEKVMAHELIHALTVKPSTHSALYEGLTEYLATLVYPDALQTAYAIPVMIVRMYAEEYGLHEAIKVFLSNDCFIDVNKVIGRKNVAETVDFLLYNVASGNGTADEVKVALDVLCHYCAAIGGNSELVESLIENYSEETINETDREYFSEILKRR